MKNIDYYNEKLNDSAVDAFFLKIYGYEQKVMLFLANFYLLAKENGGYYNQKISNPNQSEINELLAHLKGEITYSFDEIVNFLYEFDNKEEIANNFIYILNERSMKNDSIRKNLYIKMMCWIKFRFNDVFKLKKPYVIYEGSVSKYEELLFLLLSKIGGKVVVVDFLNKPEIYEENAVICGNFTVPLIHFIQISNDIIKRKNKENSEFHNNSEKNIINSSIKTDNIKTNNVNRNESIKVNPKGFSRSNDFIKDDNVFFSVLDLNRNNENVYAYIKGVNGDDYESNLYNLKEKIIESGRNIIVENNEIKNPSTSETQNFMNLNNLSELNVNFLQTLEINILARNAILDVVLREPVQKQKNLAICFMCWLNRYKMIFEKKHGVFVLFNGKKQADFLFLKVLKRMAIDVLAINPNFNLAPETIDKELKVAEFQFSKVVEVFPVNLNRTTASTGASEAEMELNSLLYNNTGFYRDRQFKKANAITIKTTFDEIEILWKAENNFRPHFKTEDNIVDVPNIFVKISGVPNKNRNKYVQYIKGLKTENSIMYNGYNFSSFDIRSPFLSKKNRFIKNNRLKIDEVMKDEFYKYDYLNNDTALFILSKIDEFISLDLIADERDKVQKIALAVLLDLNKDILKCIQNFDFVKLNPKLIIFDEDESLPSLADMVLILFLNLVGFDIVILTPTGYKNLEKYLKTDILNEHVVGDFVYDLKGMEILKEVNSKSFVDKFFKRR